jgi:hypothetical protein
MQRDAGIVVQRTVKKVRKVIARMDYSLKTWCLMTIAMAVYGCKTGWRWWARYRQEKRTSSHVPGPKELEGEQTVYERPEGEQVKEKTD